ncbi:hypothetical protein Z967_11955 [Clostridium novyi A str. 4540]|uniref:hypothetical protein n=1 Tax=Clostridium novyi TaxID=1542 RepID=UPI0004DA3828|nr:hypothetical protein [Clostridium novyi]KEH88972.1 hypothetical protein Z967_11955 [Clostridium novyi A str. 4540]
MDEKQIVYIEDVPRDWEEEIALSFRKLKKIDKDILAKALQNTTEKLHEYFTKYSIKFEVATDHKSYIDIKNFKKLKLDIEDECITIYLYNYDKDETEDVYIRINIERRCYFIEYVNAENKKIRARYNVDEFILEELFGEVFGLNS